MSIGTYFKMQTQSYILYNSVTGKIHSKHQFTLRQAQENCKKGASINLTYGLETELGFVLSIENNYVDVNVDPPVVKMGTPATVDYVAKHRAQRNTKLSATDWTVGVDSPFNDAKKLEWQTYRQALRDITFGQYMTWPTPPQ